MKGDTEVVLMVMFFLSGALTIAFANESISTEHMDSFVSAIATLIAAFLGAWFAFKLQSIDVEKQRIKAQVQAGNKVIFEFIRIYDHFYRIKLNVIAKYNDNPYRHFLILPNLTPIKPIQINFDDLAFILDSKKPNLLRRLVIFENNLISALNVIEERSRIHISELQPVMEKMTSLGGFTYEQLETEFGIRSTGKLKQLTDYLVNDADDIVLGARQLADDAYSLFKEIFPEHNIIKMGVLEEIK